MSVGDSLYSGAATVGKIDAIMGLIMGGLMAIVLCIVGSSIFTIRDKKETEAKIVEVQCFSPDPNSFNDNNCNVKIKYKVGNNEYERYIKNTTKKDINSNISILYNQDDPSEFEVKPDKYMSPFKSGIISISFGLVLCIIVTLNYYFASKYKPYAALTGLNRTGKIISDLI